jgi:hypothetical protein
LGDAAGKRCPPNTVQKKSVPQTINSIPFGAALEYTAENAVQIVRQRECFRAGKGLHQSDRDPRDGERRGPPKPETSYRPLLGEVLCTELVGGSERTAHPPSVYGLSPLS